MNGTHPEQHRVRALDRAALDWVHRCVWAFCIAIYLTVFIGGILAGGAELPTLGRAIGFTLIAAALGRTALGLLAGASLPVQAGPSDSEQGPVGSLADVVASSNVATHHDEAEAA